MELPLLPITPVLPDIVDELARAGVAVLQAPPGAGKTTLVPLALLAGGAIEGRIVMLEPRRLAARAAAERMAEILGEKTGQTVGYRIRGETRSSKNTRIEVVTEGILTRMLQSDPSLSGIGAVLFDEFHERSMHADLGLALTLEARQALRDDLSVLVMSATLDAGPVADMLGARLITSEGKAFPVETIWLERPLPAGLRLEQAAADLVLQAFEDTDGGLLVFLPGEREIRAVASKLAGLVESGTEVMPLYGALPFAEQTKAIRALASGRKIVLATSIAETSLTIDDIRVVVDCGLSRRARFDPGTGMSRLVTEKVTRAEAEQRRGRAGRVAPGTCYRMWTRGAEGALLPYPPPEIEAGDLAGFALEIAEWGTSADDLAFVTQPNAGQLTAARKLLTDIGALDASGRITEHGKELARLPLHPRLAHMVAIGGKGAAGLAAILSERDPMREAGSDILARKKLLGPDGPNTIRVEADRIRRIAGPDAGLGWPELVALAYPDRIGLRRKGDAARFVLSGGRGAVMDDHDPLAGQKLIVAPDLDGGGTDARIRRAIALSEAELRNVLSGRIVQETQAYWDSRERRLSARKQERLGAVVLSERTWNEVSKEDLALASLDGFRDLGLPWSDAARRFQSRVMRVVSAGLDMPDLTDANLVDTLDEWLLPHLSPVPRTEAEIRKFDILPALRSMLDWNQMQALDLHAPARFTLPTGRDVPVDYSGDAPEIEARLQELFGTRLHPVVAGQPLRITMLSPAGRPLQTTADLPGFWKGAYLDVRKDMRGRYPKHPWPEDPSSAQPTNRAKPRHTD